MTISIVTLGAYFFAVNAVGLFLMGQDKLMARKGSQKNDSGERRYSEGLFFFLAIVGGSLGVYAGMFLFRHKTQKLYFLIGLPILMAEQLLLLFSYSFFLQ